MMDLRRPEGTGEALVAVDATSGAGGLRFDPLGGGRLLLRPPEGLRVGRRAVGGGALARRRSSGWPASTSRAAGCRRFSTWRSPSSRAGSTRPTTPPPWPPSCSSSHQLDWMLAGGGIDFARRPVASDPPEILYGWAEVVRIRRALRGQAGRAQPRGRHHRLRATPSTPPVVARVLRANGIVDTEPYRKLGRNQLRIAMFPAIEPDDVGALTRCIDFVVEHL